MARAEALLPHPAAERGEPRSDHRSGPSGGRAGAIWQQALRLLPFSFPEMVDQAGGKSINELRVNGAIKAKEVLVIAPDGAQIGVKKLNEALWLAEQLDLDLVEVAPNAKPPVCRLMDYGKYKYEQSVKAREARKKQTRTTIKELRMKVRIGDHDFDITRRKAQEFLEEGDKVKVTIRFRGREQERPAFGKELLDKLAEELSDVAVSEQSPKLEGRSMTMVLAPSRRTKTAVEPAEEEQ
jgi:translation initiation factor IF-3